MKNGPYILLHAPEDYPGKRYRGKYAYEHQLVWWNNTGEVVSGNYLIHHKDENKHNNAFDNLEVKDRGIHTRDHNTPGEILNLSCSWCSNVFSTNKKKHEWRKSKLNQTNFFCCRSHQVRHQQTERKLRE